MNIPSWIQYFERNRSNFDEPPLAPDASPLPDGLRLPLAASLAVFQLGETGGGTRLMRYVRRTLRHQPEALEGYDLAVRLFIAEEHRHAQLLEKLVTYLGGTLLQRHWSNTIFRRLRTLFGMEFNIQILLTAELIAEAYYGLIYRKTTDEEVRSCCHKILQDEMRHIAFHTSFFQQRLTSMPRPLRKMWRVGFRACHAITATIVAWDHRRLLKSLGIGQGEFVRLTLKAGQRFLRRLDSRSSSWQPDISLRSCQKASQLATPR
ncbi:ferritin-like domain-containing protein [Verrucomicrobium spinosum]|uniref:ferritin-like domain-containing protein n=1 Tax=Verrucomicrobium spinosum TaxID=2736 RepID=UPI00017463E0|nr:ferritin-like domain-containing protein [Verrucomicrobium spinosum]